MASNITTTPVCPDWYASAGKTISFVVYVITLPVCFILSCTVYPFCLKAFYMERKKEKAYLYQAYITICRISYQSLMMMQGILAYWVFSSSSPVTLPFRSSYFCAWFYAKFLGVFIGTALQINQFLTIQQAAERCYCLWKPHTYTASLGIRRNGIITLALASISPLINMNNYFRNIVSPVNGSSTEYKSVTNDEYMTSPIGLGLSNTRNVVDAVGLVLLYVCNVALVWMYRIHRKETTKILNKTADVKRREKIERTLFCLALTQCVTATIATTYKIYFLSLFFFPSALPCQKSLHAPLVIGLSVILENADFIFVFVFCKPFRTVILRKFTAWTVHKTARVVPAVSRKDAN